MPTIVDGKEGDKHYTLSFDDGDDDTDAAMESAESREPPDDVADGEKQSSGGQPNDDWDEEDVEGKCDNNDEFEYDDGNDEYKPDDTSDVNSPDNDEGTGDNDDKLGVDASESKKEVDGANQDGFDRLDTSMECQNSSVKLGDIDVDSSDKASYSNDAGMYNTIAATKPSSFRNKKQDVFVKKGARVKSILATALQAMADGFASNAALVGLGDDAATGGEKTDTECDSLVGSSSGRRQAVGEEGGESKRPWSARADFAHVRDLAQEKTEECMALKRKLQESQAQIEVLQNEHSVSEQTNTQLKAKIDRTMEALQIAGANAANARAEADASNARAESLSGQLDDLQSVIEETKRGMEVVRSEHDEVSRAARSVEGRLIQVESELTRAAKAKEDAVEERDFLKARAEKTEKLARSLQEKVDDYQSEARILKKDLLEFEELEKVRADRTNRIEAEFQEARAGLLEATSAAAEAESTVTSLRSVVEELRRENETLHEKMNDNRDSLSKDRAKQNEALTVAEREAQKWKMKFEEAEEESRKMKLDKTAAEKQVDQLKIRMSNMERRHIESTKSYTRTEKTPMATTAITPHTSESDTNNLGLINAFGAKASSEVSEENNKRKYVADLPRRESAKAVAPNSSSRQLTYSFQKENKTANKPEQPTKQKKESFYSGEPKRKVQRTNKCCICLKEGGMIMSCQCRTGCGERAHALCITKMRAEKGKGKNEPTILCQAAIS